MLDCMGEDHILTYDTFTWALAIDAVPADAENAIEAAAAKPGEDRYDLETVFKRSDAQFRVHHYRSVKRQEFLSIQHGKNESIMRFISNLKKAAKQCQRPGRRFCL